MPTPLHSFAVLRFVSMHDDIKQMKLQSLDTKVNIAAHARGMLQADHCSASSGMC
jgi:hypothetical protein